MERTGIMLTTQTQLQVLLCLAFSIAENDTILMQVHLDLMKKRRHSDPLLTSNSSVSFYHYYRWRVEDHYYYKEVC